MLSAYRNLSLNKAFNFLCGSAIAGTALFAPAPASAAETPAPCAINVRLDVSHIQPKMIGSVEFYFIMPEHVRAAEAAFRRGVLRQCGREYDPGTDGKKILRYHKIRFIENMFARAQMSGKPKELRKIAQDTLDAIEGNTPISSLSPKAYTTVINQEPRPDEFYVLDSTGKRRKIQTCVVIGPNPRFSPQDFFQFLAAGRKAPALVNAAGNLDDYLHYIIEHEIGHGLGYNDIGTETEYVRLMLEHYPEKKPMIEAIYRARLLGAFAPETQERHGFALAYELHKLLFPDSRIENLHPVHLQRFKELLQLSELDLTRSRNHLSWAKKLFLDRAATEPSLYPLAEEYVRVLEESMKPPPALFADATEKLGDQNPDDRNLDGRLGAKPAKIGFIPALNGQGDDAGRVIGMQTNHPVPQPFK